MNNNELWQILNRRIQCAIDERFGLSSKWKDYYKTYRGILETKTFPWPDCSNINIPIAQICVDTVVASLVNSLFSVDPLFQCEAYADATEEKLNAAKKIQNFLRYATNEEIEDFFLTLIEWAEQMSIYGTGIGKLIWLTEREKRGYYDEIGEVIYSKEGKPILKRGTKWREEIVYDAPYFSVVDLDNFVAPYGSKNIRNCYFVAEKIFLPIPILKQRMKDNWYEKHDITYVARSEEEIEKVQNETQGILVSDQSFEGVYIWDYWGFAPLEGEIEVKAHIVMVDGQPIILRREENPYFHQMPPYIKVNFTQEPNRFWGIGVVEPIYPLQQAINTIHNQRIDNMSLVVNKAFTFVADGIINSEDDIQIFPGAKIEVNDHESVRILEMGDVKLSSDREESMLVDYVQRQSGVTDMNLGILPNAARRSPATSMLAVMGEGNKKLEMRIKGFREPLKQMADILKILYYQFMPEERSFKAPGADVFESITPEDFRYDVRFKISSTTLTDSPEIRKQNLLSMYALLSKNALIMSNPKAAFLLTREVLRSSGLANVDEILPETALDEFVQNMKMAQMSPGGGGGDAASALIGKLGGQLTGQAGAAQGGLSTGGLRPRTIGGVPGLEGAGKVS